MGERRTTRRSFLGRLLQGTLLTGVAAVAGSIVAYLFPAAEVSSALGPRRVKVGRPEDLPPGTGKLTLVDDEPVWVVHLSSGFAGISAWCTHKGCTIEWQEQRRLFACPCHEGLFDERGNVVSGLPLRPLTRFRVGVVRSELYVSHEQDTQV